MCKSQFTQAILLARLFTIIHPLSVDEIASKHAQLTKDTFTLLQEHLRMQQLKFEERFNLIESRIAAIELRTRPEVAISSEGDITIYDNNKLSAKADLPAFDLEIPIGYSADVDLEETAENQPMPDAPKGVKSGETGQPTMKFTTSKPTEIPITSMTAVALEETENADQKETVQTQKAVMTTTSGVMTDTNRPALNNPINNPSTFNMSLATSVPQEIMTMRSDQSTSLASTPEYSVSCAAIYKKGYTSSGKYPIKPDGLGDLRPFNVYCDMERGEGLSVIGHNFDDQNIMVNGFEKPGSFVLEPVYNDAITMQQMAALADISAECRQYAKYMCKLSGIMAINSKSGSTYGWWVDRRGQKRINFAGAPTDSQLCACGVTRTCFGGSPTCNCDHQRAKNQFDEGYFDDKDLLPVMSINLGDTGSKKKRGAVILGKFVCRG